VFSSLYLRECVEVTFSEIRAALVQHPCHFGYPNDTRRISKTHLTTDYLPTLHAVAGCATGSTRPKGAQVRDGLLGLYPLSLATGSVNQ